jgi:hypothetical protein
MIRALDHCKAAVALPPSQHLLLLKVEVVIHVVDRLVMSIVLGFIQVDILILLA